MYEIKEIKLTNAGLKKKRLIITFHDEKLALLSGFLMTDALLLNGHVLQLLRDVLEEKKNATTFCGNRCYLQINKNNAKLEDLFNDTNGIKPHHSVKIKTKKLYTLTKMWLDRLKHYNL